jgi:hypothetical protein
MSVVDALENVHRVSIDERLGAELKGPASSKPPAVLVTRNAAFVADMGLAAVHPNDIVTVAQGDWQNALLIVLPPDQPNVARGEGDARFLQDTRRRVPSEELIALVGKTLGAIRAAGVDGELVEAGKGRWVNSPLNTFTLKVQPRVENIQFTLYGNPDTYDAGEFLRADQNSYSRGWVRSAGDAEKLARLAKQAHSRRQ